MFKLAAHLGKTIGELSSMSFDEFRLWQAYDEIDPIGGYRQDLNFAMLAYPQAGNKDSKITDFFVIDPNPMTNEQAELAEQARLKAEAQAEIAAMIQMFNR